MKKDWYSNLIIDSELAEPYNIKGFMIIKPYGYAIWEIIYNKLNKILKNNNYNNVYFPLLIPKYIIEKESKHINKFHKECAILTHSKLNKNYKNDITVDINSKLDDILIIRPTSECIIWSKLNNWIKSYNDLPLLLNQWANIIRLEMRPKLFIRNTEFLWQESHSIHKNSILSKLEAIKLINIYYDFVKKYLCIPTIKGIKTKSETFAGANITYSLEAIMKDGKSLQIATSHFLGNNFSYAFNVKYTNKNMNRKYTYGHSSGISSRIIGAIVMTHSDKNGLILPPKIAPIQVIIIPIINSKINKEYIYNKIKKIKDKLEKHNIRVKICYDKKHRPGWKQNKYILMGIPIQINIGIKEIYNKNIKIFRRDNMKYYIINTKFVKKIKNFLKKIQEKLLSSAINMKNKFTHYIKNYEMFKKIIKNKKGLIYSFWDGSENTEIIIKKETNATIRCIPMDKYNISNGKCIFTNKKSNLQVIFAKSY